ncbi:MAG: hypothetical protein ACLFPQ_01610 [Candidatus Woesearchaeota archaeon]
MEQKKRNLALVFILILLFSISIRVPMRNLYPTLPDTYVMYRLASHVEDEGYITWNKNPLSLTGYYPHSYQSAGIVLLSELKLLLGTDYNTAILLWNIFNIAVFGLMIYLISLLIFKDHIVSNLVVFIYLNSRLFFYFTSIAYSVRNIYLMFFIFLLWLLFKRSMKYRNHLIILTLLMMIVSHKLFIVTPVIFLAYFTSRYITKKNKITNKTVSYVLVALTFLFFAVSFLINPVFYTGPLQTSPVSTGIEMVDYLIDFLYRYAMSIGIVVIAIPFGYYLLAKKDNKRYQDIFLLSALMFFAPIIHEQTYVFYLIIPLFTLITGYAFKRLMSYKNMRNIPFFMMSVLLMASMVLPAFVTIEPGNKEEKVDADDYTYMRERTIMLAEHLREKKDTRYTIVCNKHDIYCYQISAISQKEIDSITALHNLERLDDYYTGNIDTEIDLKNLFGIKDPLFNRTYYPGIYRDALVADRMNPVNMKKIIDFTGVNVVIDSNRADSLKNSHMIREKYWPLSKVYNNGIQQIRPIPEGFLT